ncbi:uncharacterized protein PWA37_004712 [Arxiozyma heterogenica]|uniref:Uncharacterized protein n=1 Tax=Arxiozyma heterogenica TaxID=278026 RepID=A0AAN7WJ74_9SACH|nr:hypothetical protein RI543_001120 [Kazachstania heterogenica]
MALNVSKKYLITISNTSYYVLVTKDGSKYIKFELVEEKTNLNDNAMDLDNPFLNNLIVLDSIKSGIGRNKDNDLFEIVIFPILQKLNIKYNYIKTNDSQCISNWTSTFQPDTFVTMTTVFFISGDTSISEFLNSLSTQKIGIEQTYINILPLAMGTANALANSCGLNCPIVTLNLFLTNSLSSDCFPLYKVIFPDDSSKIFFIIFSMGFHANLLHKTTLDPFYSKMGVEKFQLASKYIFENYDFKIPITVKYSIKNNNNDGPPLLILDDLWSYFILINVPYLEENYIPSPESDPFKSELHVLGYLSKLSKSDLYNRIMKGYSNCIGDKIDFLDTRYEPVNRDIAIKLSPVNGNCLPKYCYEICCDGLLFNLLDFEPISKTRENTIFIDFIGSRIGNYYINCFRPFS